MLAGHIKQRGGIVAGESARDVARRRREKAERLNKVADAYEKGALGEQQTAYALAMLPASGWFVLHDVRWPGRRFANIDHVVVGPGGVFVIDSKAWSGRIEVRGGVLRQNGFKRESAVADAAEAAMAVAEQVPGLDPYLAKPVLCFVGNHALEGWARDVMLCTPQNLVAMLLSRPPVMNAATVRRTLMHLQQSLASAASAGPRASSRRPRSRPTSPIRARSTSRPRKGGGVGVSKLFGGLALMVVGLVAMGLVLDHSDEIAKAVIPKIPAPSAPVVKGHPRAIGSSHMLPAGTNRPPLRVKAMRVGTVHRIGTLPYLFDGNRFFGVRFTVVNVGKRVWVSQPGTTYRLTDASGVPHPGGSAIHLREGQVLPDPVRLAPGHRVTGYVVFQVPADEPVTAVSLTAGPGKPRTVSWRIDRQ
jgi:hypothetical protein